jgi:hypothetical protein
MFAPLVENKLRGSAIETDDGYFFRFHMMNPLMGVFLRRRRTLTDLAGVG